MSKKDYKIRSSEFSIAEIMPRCVKCMLYTSEDDTCSRCGEKLGTPFYCGDIAERNNVHPEHICTNCGPDVFISVLITNRKFLLVKKTRRIKAGMKWRKKI